MTHRLLPILDGRVVADEVGRVPLFATAACAAAFTVELERLTGGIAIALSRSTEELAAFLALNGLSPDHLYDVEAQAENAEDALAWARELAGRCARSMAGGA